MTREPTCQSSLCVGKDAKNLTTWIEERQQFLKKMNVSCALRSFEKDCKFIRSTYDMDYIICEKCFLGLIGLKGERIQTADIKVCDEEIARRSKDHQKKQKEKIKAIKHNLRKAAKVYTTLYDEEGERLKREKKKKKQILEERKKKQLLCSPAAATANLPSKKSDAKDSVNGLKAKNVTLCLILLHFWLSNRLRCLLHLIF
jgi:hypothetical protein